MAIIARIILAVCFGFIAVSVSARESSRSALSANHREGMSEGERAEVALNSIFAQKESACLKAFGGHVFCDCLASKLPLSISFVDYIAIIEQSKEKNNYIHFSGGMKRAYDMVPAVRDACVKQRGNAS